METLVDDWIASFTAVFFFRLPRTGATLVLTFPNTLKRLPGVSQLKAKDGGPVKILGRPSRLREAASLAALPCNLYQPALQLSSLPHKFLKHWLASCEYSARIRQLNVNSLYCHRNPEVSAASIPKTNAGAALLTALEKVRTHRCVLLAGYNHCMDSSELKKG